jgi:hypothetical protein
MSLTPAAASGEKKVTGGTCWQGRDTTTCRCCSLGPLFPHLFLSVCTRLPHPTLQPEDVEEEQDRDPPTSSRPGPSQRLPPPLLGGPGRGSWLPRPLLGQPARPRKGSPGQSQAGGVELEVSSPRQPDSTRPRALLHGAHLVRSPWGGGMAPL